MRERLIKIGHKKTVLIITLISLISAVLLYLPIGYIIENNIYEAGIIKEIYIGGILITILITLIITPTLSWYFVGLLFKIHHLEVEMRDLATYDYLTSVMTRKAFLTNSELLLKLSKRDNSPLAMLYVDLDDFKKINDIYGHVCGDKVLKSFGALANENKRESDLVCRFGGEEFVFILPKTDAKGAFLFADNFRNIIKNESLLYNNETIRYTISIGISVYNSKNQINLDELISQSDSALYKAKKSGKDLTILYEA